VRKTQGRVGEVAVEVHSDVPDRFHVGMKLSALAADDTRRELILEDIWPHKGLLVFKFAGIDSISDAQALVGAELQVPAEARAMLAAGWQYVSDLVGCAVFDRDREIGVLRDVRFGAGEAPLLVVAGQTEYEIPFAEEYIDEVDLKQRRITMKLPEGMLDINAPLTDEEKEISRRRQDEDEQDDDQGQR
jgi:16S rRNA processing protein RimM